MGLRARPAMPLALLLALLAFQQPATVRDPGLRLAAVVSKQPGEDGIQRGRLLPRGGSSHIACYTIEPPGPRWRKLEPLELRELEPSAIGGLRGPGGIHAVLVAEHSVRVSLRDKVVEFLDSVEVERADENFLEDCLIDGLPAVKGMVTGRQSGQGWRWWSMAFRESGQVYRLKAWARVEESAVDGSTFADAARGLVRIEGSTLDDLRLIANAPDEVGVGWHIDDGVFQDAALGFQLAPRGSWRVASAIELQSMGQGSIGKLSAGLVSEQNGSWIGLRVARVLGVDRKLYQRQAYRAASKLGDAAGSSIETVVGIPVEMRRYSEARIPGLDRVRQGDGTQQQYGCFFQGELFVELLAGYPADLAAKALPSVAVGISSLSFLSEEERTRIAGELDRERSVRALAGAEFSLRSKTYSDFVYGFRWTTPKGHWELATGARAERERPGARVTFLERGLGLSGWVVAGPPLDADPRKHHQERIARIFEDRPLNRPSTPRSVWLGDAQGFLSWVDPNDGVDVCQYLVASALHGERTVSFILKAPPGNVDFAAATIAEALRGLELAAKAPAPTEMESEGYQDHRFGFALARPQPDWIFRERRIERYGNPAVPVEGALASFKGSGGRGLWTCALTRESDEISLDARASDLIPGDLAGAMDLPTSLPFEVRGRFLGYSSRHFSWSEGERRIELIAFRREGMLIVLGASSGPQDVSPEALMRGFALLD